MATQFLRRLYTTIKTSFMSSGYRTGRSPSSTASTDRTQPKPEHSQHSTKYLTASEIVDDIYGKIDNESRLLLSGIEDERDLIQFHHSTGRYIRNHYGLWNLDNTLVKDTHPDDLSMAIITLVWKRVRAEDKERKGI